MPPLGSSRKDVGESHEPSLTATVRKPSLARGLPLVVATLIVGVVIGVSLRWVEPITNRLAEIGANIGGVYVAQYDASRTTPAGMSEYLIVLSGNAERLNYMTFFEQHPDIEYLSESIYPNTVRVALRIPVRQALEDLGRQPFVAFVIRNYPFLLCH